MAIEETTLKKLQEKIGASKIEVIENKDDEIVQQANLIREKQFKEVNERLKALLSGNAVPPNNFVKYLLEQLRVKRLEADGLRDNVRQTDMQLKKMQERLIGLYAQCDQYLEDVKQWDKNLEKKE